MRSKRKAAQERVAIQSEPVSNGATNGYYVRQDYTLFRSIRTISQSSGVPPGLLRRLVAKELADNALDVCGACKVGELPDGGFYVDDDGPGILGTPEEVARLFSFGRPLVSSKLKRVPTRGALGNGLRVVAGAVYASGGSLRVFTNGQVLDLVPQESGETLATAKPYKRRTGTRIEVSLGEAVPADPDFLSWAETAISARGDKPICSGKTSPWSYESDSFFELLKAAGARTVRDVMQDFDGCVARAKQIAVKFKGRIAVSLSFEEAEDLLRLARSSCKPIRPERLALLKSGLPGSYARAFGILHLKSGRGSLGAELPYTVEAWCNPSCGEDYVIILVNRSPVTGDVQIIRAAEKTNVSIFGCNLGYQFRVGRKPVDLVINLQIPYMPITSNGKEPDLELFLDEIGQVVGAAANKCQRANRDIEDQPNGLLPKLPKGRPSEEQREQFALELKRFAERLKEINSRLDFRSSSRGWCYIIEEHGLPKGDFDRAQNLINECRKNGLLPIDFTREDDARSADHLESCHQEDPRQYAATIANDLHRWDTYLPVSFWDNQKVYIQLVVEKIDLKSLFSPVCERFCVPIINARGWSDLNLRAGLMRRFQEHERKGRTPILLYCGDLDPVGLQIPDRFYDQLNELEPAVGWSPRNLIIERFGLNFDFVEKHNLTWIDGLQTGSGKDLGDPNHRQHNAGFVQKYIAKYGKRKVEANALVVRPEAGRKLCLEAIQRHLDLSAIETYKRLLSQHREAVRLAMPDAIQCVLAQLTGRK